MKFNIIFLFTSIVVTSCTSSYKFNNVVNRGFEEDVAETSSPKAWIVNGDKNAVKVVEGGYDSKYSLLLSSSNSYDVCLEQHLIDVPNGIYDLSFRYKNSGGQNVCYVSAGESDMRMTSLQVSDKEWVRSVVKGIKIKNGKCVIKIVSDAKGGNMTLFDDFDMVKTNQEYIFLKGGDLSELTYIERMGGKFYEDGEEKDCFDILQKNGFNIVRLRLYNDPGNPDFSPSNRLPSGIQNPEDILNLSKRAVEHGMQILLTFHYGDYWTQDYQPHAWVGKDFETLKDSVYNFTYKMLKRMEKQGTSPQFVSIGNEINDGFLYPDGQISKSCKGVRTKCCIAQTAKIM